MTYIFLTLYMRAMDAIAYTNTMVSANSMITGIAMMFSIISFLSLHCPYDIVLFKHCSF